MSTPPGPIAKINLIAGNGQTLDLAAVNTTIVAINNLIDGLNKGTFENVALWGGSIDAAPIGQTAAAAGSFTTLTAATLSLTGNETVTGSVSAGAGFSGSLATSWLTGAIGTAVLPPISLSSSGPGGVTGILPTTNGGTGVTTAPANQVLAGATSGASAAPAFRPLVAADLPASGVTASTYGTAASSAQLTLSAAGVATAATQLAIAIDGSQVTTGTVTSGHLAPVNLSAGNVNGGVLNTLPTTNGGLGVTTAPAAQILAGATSGAAIAPAFRALVATDFPASGVTASTYGDASHIPVITVDSHGLITALSTTAAAGGASNPTTLVRLPESAAYTSGTGDLGKVIDVSGASPTITLVSAVSAGANGMLYVHSNVTSQAGNVVHVSSAAGTFGPSGLSNFSLYPGETAQPISNGTNWINLLGRRPGERVFITEVDVTAVATIDFTTTDWFSDPEFDAYALTIDGVMPGSDTLSIRYQTTGSSGWIADGSYASPWVGLNSSGSQVGAANANGTSWVIGPTNNSASNGHMSAQVYFPQFRSTTVAKGIIFSGGVGNFNVAGGRQSFAGWGDNNNANVLNAGTGIRVMTTAGGNFAAQGRIRLYGIRA